MNLLLKHWNKRMMSKVNLMNASAAQRNSEPILNVLKQLLPADQANPSSVINILEIASGTGQHHVFFARNLPRTIWQPSECDQANLTSITGYQAMNEDVTNVQPPLYIDVTDPVDKWASGILKPVGFGALLSVNLVHISPWVVSECLFRGAAHYIKPGGMLITYGPYKFHGIISPDSNVQFDASLKSRNSTWGLRDLDDLATLAEANGFTYQQKFDMPSNNHILVFVKN